MSKKILVIDDEPEVVKVVSIRLESSGYKVISAIDGKDGIRKAQEQNPDLIVMDIMMPEMQGTDAVRLLQSKEQTKHIPVIFLTAAMINLPKGEETRYANINGKPFIAIAKPFNAEKLLSEINKLIKGDERE